MREQYESRTALMEAAALRASTDPVQLPIRELIGYWNAYGRGHRVRTRIREDLRHGGLQTDPDFGVGHIDNIVRLVPFDVGVEVEPAEALEREESLRVGALKAATQTVLTVNPQASIPEAMTLMALHDYSQLGVAASSRSFMGAITWESIGFARMTGEPTEVRQATVPAERVKLTDDLLPLLPMIAQAGFVFVLKRDETLSGIVTAADLTLEFGDLARPFFLLGEIERRLRGVMDKRFTAEELAGAQLPGDDREITEAENLTLGEIIRLLEAPANWGRLEWTIDRSVFVSRLDEIRELRNGVMHFSSDLPSAQDVEKMAHFLNLLRAITDPA
jgi:restriction system protein